MEGNRLEVTDTDNNLMCIEAYAEGIVKINYLHEGEVEDTSWSVILEPDAGIDATLEDQPQFLTYTTGSTQLVIPKNDLLLQCYYNGNRLVDERMVSIVDGDKEIRLGSDADERLYGAGERAVEGNLKGRNLAIYNQTRYGYGFGEENMNICIPYLLSSKAYGIFFDNHHVAQLDLSNNDEYSYHPVSGQIRYWLLTSGEISGIVSHMAHLTGHQPLPPRWALGYIQSRFGYQDRQEAEDVVSGMLGAGFPLDALVIDLYWQGPVSEMGNLNWDWTAFPVPTDMINDFKQEGVNTVVIFDPYFTEECDNFVPLDALGYFCTNSSGETYRLQEFWAGTAGLIDLFNDKAWDWMWNKYDQRLQEGIGGLWSDLGEPEVHPSDLFHVNGTADEVHNIYSLKWASNLYNSVRTEYPDKRLFNLIRSGYAGMQRFSTFPWSADVQKTFEGMRAQIPIMLGMGICGIPYMGHDVGGFTGSPNDELYIRWHHMGAFSPVMRSHGVNDPPEPIYQSQMVQDLVRPYARLREQLIPYNYTLAWEATLNGTPLVRPVFYTDNSTLAYEFHDTEYMWGPSFLVAPVYLEGLTSRYVYFPEGIWIDFSEDMTYMGGNAVEVPAPLARLPLFVKAGSFIPMAPELQNLSEYDSKDLTIHHYPDPGILQSSYVMYNDDGEDPLALATGSHETIHFSSDLTAESITIGLESQGDFPGKPTIRDLLLVLHRTGAAGEVLKDGIGLTGYGSLEEMMAAADGYFFDVSKRLLSVKFEWDNSASAITVNGFSINPKYQDLPDISAIENVLVYPNPARDHIKIRLDRKVNDLVIEIRDMRGRLVSGFERQEGNQFTIPVKNIPDGTYLLMLKNNRTMTTRKITIIR